MSSRLEGNLVLCQSGGPTAVINASLAGVIEEALQHEEITGVYGAMNGMLGILGRSIIDLKKEEPSVIAGLRGTPSAALGSSRYKLREEDLERILSIFRAFGIRYFLVNGGNDSMDTGNRVWEFAIAQGYELRVMGIPKTIDNDLACTDHCPGYGSVARWLAIATMDSGRDTEGIYTADPIKIIECMGRDAGWVAASTSLAKQTEEDAPHLIYFPEICLRKEKFLKDVQEAYDTRGYVVIVVPECLRGEHGQVLVESKRLLDTDGFGHRQPGGVGQFLADLIAENLKIKARCDKPGTIQRSSILCLSPVDLEEAYRVGQMAVRYSVEGKSGFMVTIERINSPDYRVEMGMIELEKVANRIRTLPPEFIHENQNFVTSEFTKYCAPLVGGSLPKYVRLKKHYVA